MCVHVSTRRCVHIFDMCIHVRVYLYTRTILWQHVNVRFCSFFWVRISLCTFAFHSECAYLLSFFLFFTTMIVRRGHMYFLFASHTAHSIHTCVYFFARTSHLYEWVKARIGRKSPMMSGCFLQGKKRALSHRALFARISLCTHFAHTSQSYEWVMARIQRQSPVLQGCF